MQRAFPLLVIACLLVAPVGARAPTGDGADWTSVSLMSAEESGIVVYRVREVSGLATFWVNHTQSNTYSPWHVQLVHANGSVTPIPHFLGFSHEYDPARLGYGEGVAYAGGPGVQYHTPTFRDWTHPSHTRLSTSLDARDGWLVLAWANQMDGITFEVHLPKGAKTTRVAEGTMQAYTMRDFEDGVRMGAPVAGHMAPLVHVGDALTWEPDGSQMWGHVSFTRSPLVGRGALTFERAGDGQQWHHSFDGAAGLDENDECFCIERGRWAFTSSSDVRISFDYVGDGARTSVLVVMARLPLGTLPEDVWQVFDQTLRGE